jgi:cell wall-associated NlpC family hydrolase
MSNAQREKRRPGGPPAPRREPSLLRLTTLLLLALALAFAGTAAAEAPPPGSTTPDPVPSLPAAPFPPAATPKHSKRRRRVPLGIRVVDYARHLLGVPYAYGGSSPRTGFDCSGFVRYVWAHFGVRLPRVSYEQARVGRFVPRRALRPGDLLFFDGSGHVGLYVGRGRFIHAPHSGTVVSIARLNGPYGGAFDGARRVD